MRASRSVVLALPLALAGCPALLSDWTISGSDAVDAAADTLAGCEPDATAVCACPGGALGEQVCRPDRRYAECICSGTGSSTGGAAGSSPGGFSPDGASGSSGPGGTSGIDAGGTDASAGSGGAAGTGGTSSGGSSGSGATGPGGTGGSGGTSSSGGTGGTPNAGGTAGTGGSAPVCESLQGPSALGSATPGALGITFHSQVNATLVRFVFHNVGYADTVLLQDGVSCAVIGSTPTPPNVQAYTATVAWPLVANKPYRLVSASASSPAGNNTFEIVSGWPWTNGQNLVVDDCAGGADLCSGASSSSCGWSHQYWFNFTDLEICE